MNESVINKVKTLANSAKYDVSCASSGVKRNNVKGKVGSTSAWGVCHSFTEDGRCVSLLKMMLTNYCIYDCAYCINRRSNDIPRETLTIKELVDVTISLYRRNYIEGLFLSSGVLKNPDYTMERMVRAAKILRTENRFNGYIHLKVIPEASKELINEAGRWADRLSANLEIANEQNLKILAPEKSHETIMTPIRSISTNILNSKIERKKSRYAPTFSPAGQSTQLIVGATDDSDKSILFLSDKLYKEDRLKRVYYSGYIPVNSYDKRLPVKVKPTLIRENRLYQTDWLLRFYNFSVTEIVNDTHPNLDLDIDPKLSWALRNPHYFPIDVNTADYEMILRIPGVGTTSAYRIIAARAFGRLSFNQLKKIGIVMKRAKYFIVCRDLPFRTINEITPMKIKADLLSQTVIKRNTVDTQLKLF